MSDFSCLLCGAGHYQTCRVGVRDNPTSTIVSCDDCNHVQLFPVPSDAELQAYYQAEQQRKAVHGHLSWDEKQQHVQADTARRCQLIAGFSPAGVLDVGCGEGFLGDPLEEQHIGYTGFDVTRVLNLMQCTYDVVTVFHVLEHVPNSVEFLRLWWAWVAPSGHLILEVPNHNDWLIDECPPYAAWHYQSAHIHYFTPETLCHAVRQALGDDIQSWTLHGIQRYSLCNALHWLDTGAPQIKTPIGLCSADHTDKEEEYRLHRERSLTCDTLVLVIQKGDG